MEKELLLKKEFDFILDQRGQRKMSMTPAIDKELTEKYQNTQFRRMQKTITHGQLAEDVAPSTSTSEPYTPQLERTRGIKRNYSSDFNENDILKDTEFKPPKSIEKELQNNVKLMDSQQAHTSDKKAVSNRALADILKNDANKINNNSASDIIVKAPSKSTVHRNRVKARNEQINVLNEELQNQQVDMKEECPESIHRNHLIEA